MKNKAKILGAGLLALLLMLAGCVSPLSEKPEATSGGTIVVRLAGLDARTLGPDLPADLVYRLRIEDTTEVKPFIEAEITDITEPAAYSVDAISTWKVIVSALNDGVVVAYGDKASVTVAKGKDTEVTITLLPVTTEDAYGVFDYDIDFPAESTANFGYSANILKLTPVTGGTNVGVVTINLLDPAKDADTLQLPAGKYTLDITLTSSRAVGNHNLKAFAKETVYIYPGLTTKAHYTGDKAFTLANFSSKMQLSGTAAVTDTQATGDYIPKKVQLRKYNTNDVLAEVNVTVVTHESSPDTYAWELPVVVSEDIGGPGDAVPEFRLVIADEDDASTTLTGPWVKTATTISKQITTDIPVSATVYHITKSGGFGFQNIADVSNTANNDAIGGSEVTVQLNPATDFIANTTIPTVSGVTAANITWTVSNRNLSFKMPNSNTAVFANFTYVPPAL
jgi:hypothetical protein